MAAAGEMSWHGFACAIVEGLKARGVKLAVEQVVPISTDQYPTKARRPRNSRLDLTRLAKRVRHHAAALAGRADAGSSIELAQEFSNAPSRG